MNKLKKLHKNIDNKLLTINYIGSRGEGVSKLTTEINYKESDYNFFVPFTLPGETVVVKPTIYSSEGVDGVLKIIENELKYLSGEINRVSSKGE